MPDSIMYDENMFVVLETNQPERFLSPEELFETLKVRLTPMQDDLPRDLEPLDSIDEQARTLMETGCELDLGPDQFLQWYAVRMDK